MSVCDFCYEANPLHHIPCRSFWVIDVVPVTAPMQSIGEFMACTACNGLILANNHEGLVRRARESFIRRRQVVWSLEAELELRQFYKQFWENRL